MAEKNRPAGANKYSVYQQRDLETEMVDWGAIAQDINKGIQGVMADREARKAAITQNTQDALDKLSEVQDVDNQDIQSLIIDGSDNTKKAVMEANYLLKQGLMTEKDYALVIHQQKAGYGALNNLAKNADAKYKEAMTRLAEGDSSALEDWNNNTLLGFGNLKNTKLVSNPLTGELQMVRLIKNPKYVANSKKPGEMEQWIMPDPKTHPENYQSPTQMTKASTFKLDRVTTKGLATTQTEGLASVITSTISNYSVLSGGGDVTKVTNFRQIFDLEGSDLKIDGKKVTYEDFMNAQVDAVVGPADQKNNMNAAQVLGEMGYEIGGSCEEVKERTNNTAFDCSKWIKATNSSGTPVVTLTKEQQKAARDRVRIEMEAHLDNETKKTAGKAGQQITTGGSADLKAANKRAGYIGDLNTILTGDLSSAKTTLSTMIETRNKQNIQNQMPTITDFDLTDDTIMFYYSDGTTSTIKRNVYDDPTTTDVDETSENSIAQDVAGMYDILVPAAASEEGGLSDTEIFAFINDPKNKITLGQKGTGRKMSFKGSRAKPGMITKDTKLKATDKTLKQTLEDAGMSETVNRVIDWDTGVGADVERTFLKFFSAQASKRFNEAGFKNLDFEVDQDKDALFVTYIDTNKPEGEQKIRIEFGGEGANLAKSGTTSAQIANAIAETINQINTDAHTSSKGQTRGVKVSFKEWQVNNPWDPSKYKTFADYMAEYNKQYIK